MDKATSESGGEGRIYLILFLAALGIVFLPALVLAIALFFGLRGRLRAIELVATVLLSLLGLVLFAGDWVISYFVWLGALFGLGSGDRSDGPWIAIGGLAVFFASAGLLADARNIIPWMPVRTGKSEPILPTEKEKQVALNVIVSAPDSALLAEAGSHTLDSPSRIGQRSFPIGVDKRGTPVMIHESEFRTHGLLFGSTGSGKTETIKVIAGGLMDLGWSGMILDLKEDAATGGLLDWCQTYADYHAIGFQSFRLSDPMPMYWFNALHGMGPDEARDTILASQEFEAAFYRALNEQQLGQLVTLLYAANQIDPVKYLQPTVYDIGKILSSRDLAAATRDMVATVISTMPTFSRDDFHSLMGKDKNFIETAMGLGARLTAMYDTQAGRMALRPGDNRAPYDVTKSGLSYVGLDSMGKPELTRLVSASVLRRMAVYAADRTSGKVNDKQPRFLIVDEANFVNRRLLLELLSRARSAGIACLVCTQGPTDWQSRQPGEPDLTSLVQNTNVAIIMSQGERTNAELCADIIGRAERSVVTQRVEDGVLIDSGSMSTTVDYLVPPDYLRGLTTGEAIVRVGKPQEWQRWIRVRQRDPKAVAGRQ